MSKNIVILCDGTSNEISQDRTNILRLFGCLKKSPEQSVFYDPGVGTFGAENSASYYYRRGVEIWGLATGWGLDANVKEAYRYLVKHYEHKPSGGDDDQADQIYIFGFSRGAYTARVLAGFIHAVGLLHPDNLNLLDYAYRAYKGIGGNAGNEGNDRKFAEVRLFERMLRPTRPRIRFLGLFDTVGSVIESGRFGPRLRSHAFTSTNSSVKSIRHALALDERRTMFQPQLWPTGKPYRSEHFNPKSEVEQDAKEVWFVGSHGDVGGGYPEPKSAIAKIPLEWMIHEAQSAGLKLKTRTINTIVFAQNGGQYVGPDAQAPINDSMTRAWSIIEGIPRFKRSHIPTTRKTAAGVYIPWFEERIVPDGANIHSSVFEHNQCHNAVERSNLPRNYNTF
ncbi:DUF2235 domain-containing protein [Pseudophaeobacter sp. EL27]|uniref:T6SS phospholipase effector Tle1-like catalytic domain-containing protein n=1 Tax=Pseudophaeobacter sp. EL27 TaxID=2107580 RepID=UPI000EFD9E79|nr:DUF2235 domain-containing protein [Pseudophaeobacter sp. EL27]